jgi:hypothetical protein
MRTVPDDRLMIEPDCCARRSGATAWQQLKVPATLTCHHLQRTPASLISSNGPIRSVEKIPALLTSASRPPKLLGDLRDTRRVTAPNGRLTSSASAVRATPGRGDLAGDALARLPRSHRSRRRSRPRPPKRSASARPMPCPAPVMITVFACSRTVTPARIVPRSPAARSASAAQHRRRWNLGRRAMPRAASSDPTMPRDVSVLLSPPRAVRSALVSFGRAVGARPSSGCARSRSRSLERAVISLDGGVATPRGDARCSFHASRASRIGAGGRD